MKVSFHLNDSCDLKCEDCHWFSSPVKWMEAQSYLDYIRWIMKHRPSDIRLSGGEPTLYPQLNKLFTFIPSSIKIDLFTNGNNLHLIDKDLFKEKCNLNLKISVNREVSPSFISDIKKTWHKAQFFSFHNKAGCYKFNNQMKEKEKYKYLLGKEIVCSPTLSRFATDGYEYYCEKGLRSKDFSLRTGNSLWNDYKLLGSKKCIVTEECLSCFVGEQKIITID